MNKQRQKSTWNTIYTRYIVCSHSVRYVYFHVSCSPKDNTAKRKGMDQKPIFIIITADDCLYCKQMKADGRLARLENSIRQLGVFDIKPIPLAKRGQFTGFQLPKDIQRFIKWYPTFFIVTSRSWSITEGRLEGVIFNGTFDDKGDAVHQQMYPLTPDGVTAWAKREYETNPMFKVQAQRPPVKIEFTSDTSPVYVRTSGSDVCKLRLVQKTK